MIDCIFLANLKKIPDNREFVAVSAHHEKRIIWSSECSGGFFGIWNHSGFGD